ncbi:hypothetical protein ATCV1_z683R [Acanthocystis turfacea chlorella virus 1]|uniref:Uncharacterized protein z683R n=1 Tax=Chlorovirus heliozoae TaxID=322019 RepID=A7K9U3_9PHYC|nr:hypothetical protein ATCV1_z683R [Acanthocystis turfacea chlorella virus 1]ABT16817.1 hypothetical protein ATCV1_z683R [Acanthocystis turfacea chlorella virus 1]
MMDDTFVRPLRCVMSHATLLTSMWFVGSSRSRMSASMRMARVRDSFIFQPPDREPIETECLASSKPYSRSVWIMRSGELRAATLGSDER